MSIKIITDTRPGELEILTRVNIYQPLTLVSGEGVRLLNAQSPQEGWTHQAILDRCAGIKTGGQVVDAFLGKTWVGSTEV
ncbi:hypothetical protein [Thiomicrorhabdus aquaedulcis]|uniref:hypothetical protein n=1 Tax=Thiomicrorhabdus aquaedulcis TaxID=2211106 RepID=UPI000FDAA588|nr:hypothetical protein [Thiomicrorhabdus aquaedulcis]